MIFVLEGPDGAGKTTLGHKMAEMLECEYVHATWDKQTNEHMDVYHTSYLLKMIHASAEGRSIVVDRWWPSETAYASVFRDPMRWNGICRCLDRVFQRLGGVYIMCLPEEDVMLHNIAGRQNDPRPEFNSKAIEVRNTYNPLVRNHTAPDTYLSVWRNQFNDKANCFIYDYMAPGFDLDVFLGPILYMASVGEHSSDSFGTCITDDTSWAGNIYASTAIVLNNSLSDPKYGLGFPAFTCSPKGQGMVINDYLDKNMVDERSLFWVNIGDKSYDRDGLVAKALMGKKVNAMGSDVSEELQRLSIPHKQKWHPGHFNEIGREPKGWIDV